MKVQIPPIRLKGSVYFNDPKDSKAFKDLKAPKPLKRLRPEGKRSEGDGRMAAALAVGEPQFAADYVIWWLSDANLGYIAALTADVDAVGGINYALALQVVEFHGCIGIVLVQIDGIDAGYYVVAVEVDK